MAEKISTQVTPTFPLVFFSDLMYGQVLRSFINENDKRVLVIRPEPLILKKFPKLQKEADENGTITLKFDRELVRWANEDPASPRMKVLSDINGNITDDDKKSLIDQIRKLKQERDNAIFWVIHKQALFKGLVSDMKGTYKDIADMASEIKLRETRDTSGQIDPSDVGG